MASKANITLKMNANNENFVYTGRFLGFIKPDEFNALVQNQDQVAGKLESKATQSMLEVASKMDNIMGMRLVMTVKTLNNKSVITKKLFVSPPCDMISSVGAKEVIIDLEDDGNSLVVEEEKDED